MGLFSSVSDILTFLTLRLGLHASVTRPAAAGGSDRPSPTSPEIVPLPRPGVFSGLLDLVWTTALGGTVY
jgi:hypothetical protein